MIRASHNGKRILLCSEAHDAQHVARLPGAKRAPNMQPHTYFLPLCDGALQALHAVGADFSPALADYERQRQRLHAFIEQQKQASATRPLLPIPLRKDVTLYNHQIRAYNIALALFGYPVPEVSHA